MSVVAVAGCGLLGLAVGSFLNVVVHRVPLGLSVVRPGSSCPSCATVLRPWDNIPLLSWILLRGRCRACGMPISLRYPALEALTAAVFVVTALRFGLSWSLPAQLAFVAGLLALAAVDLERYLLPRAIVYPTLGIVATGLLVAAFAGHQWGRLGVAAFCAIGSFALFFIIQFVRPRWLGFGDVRLAALLGLALGWLGGWTLLVAFMAANLLGATVGIALMAAGRASRTTALPYGAFLTAGALFALVWGAPTIAWYSHTFRR